MTTCSVDLATNLAPLEECGAASPTRWSDEESTVADDDDNTVAGLILSSAPSLSAAASDIGDLEGMHEEFAPCVSARLFDSDYLLSSEEQAMEYLTNLDKHIRSEPEVANRVVQGVWYAAGRLESRCMWQRPNWRVDCCNRRELACGACGKCVRKEESRILQCAIECAEPSFVHQAAADLVEMVEWQGLPDSTDISCLFKGNYSNYVVQKLCTHAWQKDVGKLACALVPFCSHLAQDRAGCRIMQRILESCSQEQFETTMLPTLVNDFYLLCRSEHGGTVLTSALEQHPGFCYWVLPMIETSAAKHRSTTFVYEALINALPDGEMLELVFQRLAHEGLAGLLLDCKGVHSLKAFARRPVFRQRLADELRYSPTLNRCRQKPYAKDLIKTLKI